MQPPHHHSRINLTELKVEIVRKLGPEKSKQYFHFLRSFLSLKLSKVEFNKLCVKILGRENLPLHNLLIRSILKNACSAKVPPQVNLKEIPSNDHRQNGPHTTTQAPGLPGFANGGDILPVSPKKARTRRSRSALGPNGEANFASQLRDFIVISENGKPMHHHQELTEQEGNETIVHSNDLTELNVRDEENEIYTRSMVKAPLGIPLCPVSIGGAHKARYFRTYNDGALLDNLTLRERMEQIAASQGLEGVSIDCANVLNHGLDCYLKNLIRSCIDLLGARLRQKPKNANMKLVNGVRPGYHQQMNDIQECKAQFPISLEDFRVAMELNPGQLGEDWPLLLEKICTHSFEE